MDSRAEGPGHCLLTGLHHTVEPPPHPWGREGDDGLSADEIALAALEEKLDQVRRLLTLAAAGRGPFRRHVLALAGQAADLHRQVVEAAQGQPRP